MDFSARSSRRWKENQRMYHRSRGAWRVAALAAGSICTPILENTGAVASPEAQSISGQRAASIIVADLAEHMHFSDTVQYASEATSTYFTGNRAGTSETHRMSWAFTGVPGLDLVRLTSYRERDIRQ